MAVMLPFYEGCNQPFGIYVAGWSRGAMVLGKFQVSGSPTIKMIVRQGPTALAVGAVGVVLNIFILLCLSLPLGDGPI